MSLRSESSFYAFFQSLTVSCFILVAGIPAYIREVKNDIHRPAYTDFNAIGFLIMFFVAIVLQLIVYLYIKAA
jgi:divalent metal cation (Fe/Co/Zn/Cd) transporter